MRFQGVDLCLQFTSDQIDVAGLCFMLVLSGCDEIAVGGSCFLFAYLSAIKSLEAPCSETMIPLPSLICDRIALQPPSRAVDSRAMASSSAYLEKDRKQTRAYEAFIVPPGEASSSASVKRS